MKRECDSERRTKERYAETMRGQDSTICDHVMFIPFLLLIFEYKDDIGRVRVMGSLFQPLRLLLTHTTL